MTAVKRLIPWVLGAFIATMWSLTLAGVGNLSFYDDEFIHLNKLQTFLDYGWYIVNDSPAGSTELVQTRGHLYVYGPLFSLIAHGVAVLVGVETWGTVSAATDAFAVRHYVVAAFSFLGVVVTGWGVKLVTRSVTWGLSAAAVLVAIPLWTGSAMYNIKDVAPATGFTLFTVGLIAWSLPVERRDRATRIGGWVALYSGTLLFWGIRPGLWPAIVLGFLALALVHLRFANFRSVWATLWQLWVPATSVVASYLTMLAVYPQAFLNPVVLLYKSFADTSSFAARRASLTDGSMPTIPPSWDFLPRWALAQLPEVLGALTVVATGVAVWLVARRLFQSSPNRLDYAVPAVVFAFMQFAAFPVAAILLRSTITSGLRQFLFVLPGAVLLVFLVLFIAVTSWKLDRRPVVWRSLVGLFAASTALAAVLQFQLFPYVANYFTPSTFARGIEGRWEVDRYRLSDGELFGQLSDGQRHACSNCSVRQFPEKFVTAEGSSDAPVADGHEITLNLFAKDDPNCSVVATVSRPYLWDRLTIAYANDCPSDTAP